MDEVLARDVCPSGELRLAVAVGPAVSATFAVRDSASGQLRGVTVTLGRELARSLAVPVRFVSYDSSGAITAAAGADEWDVTFVPVDEHRRQALDFGPAYHAFDSTYLVRAGLTLSSLAEIDRAGVRVAAVADTTTARRAAATLSRASLETHASVEVLRRLMAEGEVDAIALSRTALAGLARGLPGSHLLEEAFHASAVAVAVPRGRSRALAVVSRFIESAKLSGSVRRALDAEGLYDAQVAPPDAGARGG
jgi:polar amino acid transport system substrate-binding protein